jgi:hypothetical protein
MKYSICQFKFGSNKGKKDPSLENPKEGGFNPKIRKI